MRTIKKSTPADDSVNPPWVKPFSIEQIPAVTKFLPILESINPEDLARVVKPPALEEDSLVVGHLEYHPANSCGLAMTTASYSHLIGQRGLGKDADT